VAKTTPRQRIQSAVGEELLDLCARATEALGELPPQVKGSPLFAEALAALSRSLQAGAGWDAAATPLPPGISFPREALASIAARAAASDHTRPLAASLEIWIAKHRALEHRLHWLINGTSTGELLRLDPIKDCDRIFNAVS